MLSSSEGGLERLLIPLFDSINLSFIWSEKSGLSVVGSGIPSDLGLSGSSAASDVDEGEGVSR